MIFDYHTEAKTLVALLNDPDTLTEGLALLTEAHFAEDQHRKLFSLLRDMQQAGKTVSVITVAEECRHWTNFKLRELMDTVFVTRGELDYLARRLEDMRQGRSLQTACLLASQRVEHEETEPVLQEVSEALFTLSLSTGQKEQILSGRELSVRALEYVQKRRDEVGRNQRILYSGFPKLNRVTGGFEAGDLVILSGPTGSGKSAFCQNIMAAISVVQTLPSLYINSEMSEEQMALRWGAMLATDPKVTHTRIRAGKIDDQEQDNITDGLERLYHSRFACLTIPDLRVDKVIHMLRRYAMQTGIRAAAVDYIGRMDMVSDTKSERKEWELLLWAARRLKTLAQQLQIVIFMVAQVKKDGSLQLASYMENEADLHLRLEPMSEAEAAKHTPWNYRLQIAKGRNCAKGFTFLKFDGDKLKFWGEA